MATPIAKFFYPQAAVGGDLKTAEKYWDDDNYIGQEKLDGARYILHKDNSGRVRIYSRRVSTQTGEPVVKTLQLAHLAREFDELVPNGTVFDGEVVAPGKSTFNLVTAVTGSKPERAAALQEERGYLEYRAFDILAYDGTVLTDAPYRRRHEALCFALRTHKGRIQTLLVAFGDGKRMLYDEVIKNGGEGIILKDIHAEYHQGDRHKSWVKVKRAATYDVVFMGIEMANEESVKKGASKATRTRIAGKAGAIKFGQYVVKPAYCGGGGPLGDNLFAVISVPESRELTVLGQTSGFDDATRDDITENHAAYIGRVFEITAQGRFPKSGAFQNPRFVQWRDDKHAEDCVFRADEG